MREAERMAYKSDSIDDEQVTAVPGSNQMRTSIELPDISPRIWGLMMQIDELN